MANLEKLVEELSTLTVLEAANLSKMLEEKWGVSAAAPVAVAAAPGSCGHWSEAPRPGCEYSKITFSWVRIINPQAARPTRPGLRGSHRLHNFAQGGDIPAPADAGAAGTAGRLCGPAVYRQSSVV